MEKKVNVMEKAIVWSPRCRNYLRWETDRGLWLALASGRTIWTRADDDEVEAMMEDIRDAIIE